MQRADTTARKWNASRPTYDEDWSDDEYAADEELPRSYERNVPILHQKILKAPWEPQSEEDLGRITNDKSNHSTHGISTNAPDRASGEAHELSQATNRLRPTYTLEDQAVAPVSKESVSHTTPVDFILPPQTNTSIAATPRDHATTTAQEARPSSPDRQSTSDPDSVHADPVPHQRTSLHATEDVALPARTSIESPARQLLATSGSNNNFFADDEDMRLQALMFNPENLPSNEYSDDDRPGSSHVIQSPGSSGSSISQVAKVEEKSVPLDIPSYPTDFRDGLKSRALSDAILETMHSPTPQIPTSTSTEDLTLHSAVTAERTPSMLLTTSAWAEKNRLLKEQLEKNKRIKAESQNSSSTTVRASTYDHEYDYQQSLPRTEEPRQQYNENVETRQQPSPNLRTLVEEEEDEGEDQAQKSDTHRTRRYSPIRPESNDARVTSPAIAKDHVSHTVIDTSPPISVPSPDMHKSLPPVHDSGQSDSTHSDTESASGASDVEGEEDTALTAEQEYALVQQFQRSSTHSVAPHQDKNLPPILQVAEKGDRKSLPEIQTRSTTQQGAQSAEYTPSMYSAYPPTTDGSSAERELSFQIVPAIEHNPERSSNEQLPNPDRPLSKSWEPLKASSRSSVHSPVRTAEISRFSTSTTQSAEVDEYQFDMHDAFNPAMLGTLEDNPYSDDEEYVDNRNFLSPESIRREDMQERSKSSTSIATLQPPLRHMQSHVGSAQNPLHAPSSFVQDNASTTESERLADELLQQLSTTAINNGSTRAISEPPHITVDSANRRSNLSHHEVAEYEDNTASISGSSHSPVAPSVEASRDQPLTAATETETEQMGRTIGRARSGSTGSKFLEVMSPMTSMDQQRISQPVSYATIAQQSANLMRYKDIKQISSRTQRTAEYVRRTKALQESSNGLRNYLLAVQGQLRERGRDLPAPVVHIEFKASKSIIPDKFVPHDLSRTTVRLGDRSKDAAKGLLSKSTKGFKGLFHSNSRSVSSGSHKTPNISAPVESNGPNRTASMIAVTQQRSVSSAATTAPTTELLSPLPPQNVSPQPPRLTSPISQKSSREAYGNARSPNHHHHQHHQGGISSPPPQSPAYSEVDPTVLRIRNYFPGISTTEIERALDACERDEQRAIGYLVVHRGH